MSYIAARVGASDLLDEEVVGFAPDGVETLVMDIQKRDNDGADEAGSSEIVSCCPSSLLAVDASSKVMDGSGVASFTFGPVTGLRGRVLVEFSVPGLGCCQVIIEVL